MRSRRPIAPAVLGASLVTGACALVLAGPLNPPAGPVASTFKTLAEVEPRIAINAVNTPGDATCLFRISQPGSYYLTGNVTGVVGKHGIQVIAESVTIDLCGFRLRGPGLDGISVTSTGVRVRVHNGTVADWSGVGVGGLAPDGVYENLQINSCGQNGLTTGPASVVRACTADQNGGSGFQIGLAGSVSDSTSSQNGEHGFFIGQDSTIRDCVASLNASDGINANSIGAEVRGCHCVNNTLDGIRVPSRATVVGNVCRGNGVVDGAGIHATGPGNTIEGNSVFDNDRGIHAEAAGNLVVRNRATGNPAPFDLVPGNAAGPTVNSATILTNTSPHANYAY